ncbi:MAG TPA: transporter substrate-binding domain-containing protein [Paucimonas sp.]|nr:transporter substrate-binding domain-containing protein [Paucimonas sp.]
MMIRSLFFLLAVLPFGLSLPCAARAASPEIVFLAPTNHTMPLSQFQGGQLSGGLIKDLGEAIAERAGRKARFLSVPGKRVAYMLTAGQADGVCYVLNYWIDGDFHWTRPFIPNGAIVAARAEAPVIRALGELADEPVGTVLGYRYPRAEEALGNRFLRNDAPDMAHNLRKLAVGRVRYAITEELSLAWHLRNDKVAKLRNDLVFERFDAQCAFSRKSRVPAAEIDRAIDALIKDGSVTRILARYR